MLRGDIRIVDFGRGQDAEASARRPAVIVSNDGANIVAARLGRGVLTVVPLTSNTDRLYPFQVFIGAVSSGLDVDSKAQAEQVRAVGVQRIGEKIGQVSAPLMLDLDDALRLHISL